MENSAIKSAHSWGARLQRRLIGPGRRRRQLSLRALRCWRTSCASACMTRPVWPSLQVAFPRTLADPLTRLLTGLLFSTEAPRGTHTSSEANGPDGDSENLPLQRCSRTCRRSWHPSTPMPLGARCPARPLWRSSEAKSLRCRPRRFWGNSGRGPAFEGKKGNVVVRSVTRFWWH